MGKLETATLGAGCFWCTEAIYQELKGIKSVVPGYSGGHTANPTAKEVYSGSTGHAEVAQITFDPAVISYEDLLNVFWTIHDPTSLNKQGYDVGECYRSVIFYHNDKQKQIALTAKEQLEKEKIYEKPIVTEISEYKNFYEAEDYHKDFYKNNRMQPYCLFIIDPKLSKLRKQFRDKLKKAE